VPVHHRVTDDPEQMPSPIDVERLLCAASSRLGASEAATLAQASARMYAWARAIPGAAAASATDGPELVGFGYGYSWDWTSMTDPWSMRLHDRLAGAAAALDDSFSVVLLVVAPDHRRSGLGAQLLRDLAAQADETVTWLQTGSDSDLHALCSALGWQALVPGDDPVVLVAAR
jgi:GNAT superfamily N-acetyltransferase